MGPGVALALLRVFVAVVVGAEVSLVQPGLIQLSITHLPGHFTSNPDNEL